MNTSVLIVMLVVSIMIGFLGLLAFLWGLKTGQFDDEKKMTQGVLFDGIDDLNEAALREEKQKIFKGTKMNKIYDVAIIGAGPGGIASAVESVIIGIKDTIMFEKGEEHSSTIRKFYKDNKRVDKDYKGQKVELNGNIFFDDGTKESTLELFSEIIQNHNIQTHFKTEIESIKKAQDIFTLTTTDNQIYQARYIVVSIGKMGQPNKPSYKIPITLLKKVAYNINDCKEGEKILVVGGGNSAVEYACYLATITDTTLNYRRNEFNRINDYNAQNLKEIIEQEKLKTKFGIDIEGLEDIEGKIKVLFTDKSSDIFDRVIYAIGGVAPVDFLKKCGIELDANNIPIINEKLESSVKNLFVAGDILFKSGGSIATALNHGHQIIKEIKNRI
ncbi:cbb3-type cytochrome oxidase assembly protein CcoS [Helicobacter sp. 13S00477-4]|uniref:cbb3-type cytochrome oxidase assembly protein CcoS n=1 Tax=Helicobacter sp. 13S00477-4 TaxID=1905759 RepID=UPI000BA6CF64|nr:cbb3-type cytochrome oxidase assembly protein CcoS [Helicobacter sp. 13S00477-4]